MELSVCKIKIFLIFPEIELSSHIFFLYFKKKLFKLIKKKKKIHSEKALKTITFQMENLNSQLLRKLLFFKTFKNKFIYSAS